MNEQPCVFCAIVHGEAEASVVHQDETVLALMDLRPVTPGHLLVIPRNHIVGLADLDAATGAAIWQRAHQLAGALRRSGLRCAGVNFFLADGEAAFQEVFHLHLHVFPRYAGDRFRISADWRERPRAELDAAAALIRAAAASS
ncbi:HIT family protein [Streptomyces profundus]|uniref:HIT family protein n=1 Tax=Streptomyces profundus TaxID=2867410 RepID=UPI001D16A193|nr:HIT domain-containing protein [Streptomyces sp. MA3_2.13]UED87640.1 HIT domain-containing protein [Streptomyces sp. MA3_2.13]